MPFLPSFLPNRHLSGHQQDYAKRWRFLAFFGESPQFTGEQRWGTALLQNEAALK
jgi:hypothetical protein